MNEAQLNKKRIEFRELELLEQERIEKVDKLSKDINLNEAKSDGLRKELEVLVDEIENKKAIALDLSDQIKNDKAYHQEKILLNKNLDSEEREKVFSK